VTTQLKAILRQFQTVADAVSAERIGSGHIHETYRVLTEDESHPGYILQRFNHYVFPDFRAVTDNLLLVSAHLGATSDYAAKYRVAEPVAVRDDLDATHSAESTNVSNYVYSEADGTSWRLFRRIAPGISFDRVPDEAAAYEAGRIYGSFLAALRDFPVGRLHEVIPGFHSVDVRFAQLEDAVLRDAAGRVAEVHQHELRIAQQYIDLMRVIPQAQQSGGLPMRVTHNDTKLNNVLFDADHRAVAVVDLDTVMPGLSLYDFGDLVRTAANTGQEDGDDAAFSLQLYRVLEKGFLHTAGAYLTPQEIKLMPLAPQYMAYIMAIRFLADYLNGDVYYTISRPQHNLDRCRAQFRLLESMREALEDFDLIEPGRT
jgi:Ser/Thr protein kinase RdoA (MazF antagonist)